jgi:phosphoglycolate phosphatase
LKLILFDCDGTLVDSQHVIVASMNLAFEAVGLVPPTAAETRSIIGLSLPVAMTRLTIERDENPVDELVAAYKAAFRAARLSGPAEPMFPGIAALLAALDDRPDVLLGVATGKSRRGLDAILASHGLTHHFATLKTADDAPSKPHPGMVLDAIAETGARPEDTAVVGDTSFDMAMARAAGATGIGVAWGYHPVASLVDEGAVGVAVDADELGRMLDDFIADASLS